MKKYIISVALCMMVVCLMTSCGSSNSDTEKSSENPTVKTTFALMVAKDHPQSVAAKTVMAKEVKEKTNGKFIISVKTDGALGSDSETVEATQMGNMDMTGPTAATLATLDDDFYILDIPYVFTSKEMARNALDGELGDYLSKSLEKKCGLIVLGWGESGMRGLSNDKKVVDSPDDLSGMKIRTLENKYHLATFKALGANPTAMAFSEVYTALQTGQIDGQDNAISITYTNKFYEVQKYYTKLEHLFNANTYVVNADWYHNLPKNYQKILKNAVQDAVKKQRELVDKEEKEEIKKMKNAGVTVTTLTDAQKQKFINKTKSVRDSYIKKYGSKAKKLIKLANKYKE